MNRSLNCQNITISMHALKAMIKRGISVVDVIEVAENGEIIADYPSEKPYPSCLVLNYVKYQAYSRCCCCKRYYE